MSRRFLPILLVALVATAASGCASRRYVRNRTDPINQQVGALDKRSTENAQKIGELDEKTSREIARVGEKANAADARAGDASRLATDALTKGGQAMEKADGARSLADGARSLAESGLARAGQLERYIENYDNFQVALSKTVYFGFAKSALTDEATKDLDELAQSLSKMKKYVVEVQGFTDSTGNADYNYALSEKRAASVVRYITEKHSVPVYRVHTIGLGNAMPAQADDKREARKLSRRVEVKVYTRPELQQAQQTGSGSTSGASTTAPSTSQPTSEQSQQAVQLQQRRP